MPLQRTNSWGSMTRPRQPEETGSELEPPPSARGEVTGGELWKEEAAANGFDPNLLFTRSDSQKFVGKAGTPGGKGAATPEPSPGGPVTRTRSREGFAAMAAANVAAGAGNWGFSPGLPLSASKRPPGISTSFNALPSPGGMMMPSPGGRMMPSPGGRLTRSQSDLGFVRVGSLGEVDMADLMDLSGLGNDTPTGGASLTRTQSQERLTRAYSALGMQAVEGQALTRMNSRGMRGVAQANQEFQRGRAEDLALDLFGLDGLIMGPPTPAMAQMKRAREEHSPSAAGKSPSSRTPKRSKSDGPSPRARGQEKAALASEEASRTPTGEDPWVGRQVKLKRGKYEGRAATVLGKTSKKYQVQVEGVPYQLEFYSTMFVLPEHYKAPKSRKKKKPEAEIDFAEAIESQPHTEVLEFGITISQDDIPPELIANLTSPMTRTRSQERLTQDLALGL